MCFNIFTNMLLKAFIKEYCIKSSLLQNCSEFKLNDNMVKLSIKLKRNFSINLVTGMSGNFNITNLHDSDTIQNFNINYDDIVFLFGFEYISVGVILDDSYSEILNIKYDKILEINIIIYELYEKYKLLINDKLRGIENIIENIKKNINKKPKYLEINEKRKKKFISARNKLIKEKEREIKKEKRVNDINFIKEFLEKYDNITIEDCMILLSKDYQYSRRILNNLVKDGYLISKNESTVLVGAPKKVFIKNEN